MKTTCSAVLAVSLLCLMPLTSQAIEFSFRPTPQVADVGELVEVQLRIEGLAGTSLGTFDLLVGFNPSILRFAGVTFGDSDFNFNDQLACPGLPSTCTFFGSLTSSTGQTSPLDSNINLFEVSFAPVPPLAPVDVLATMQAAAFNIGTLSFEGLSVGNSPLQLGVIALGDSMGNPLLTSTISPGRILVGEQVPVPSSLPLLLLGLAVLAGVVRKTSLR
ncbi:MAG: hypothetical protein NPIRA02_13290 [Nitrospirales bacterium]|nr:MAG: hypothetical protein NPIRA02_13290 [Nitrospirales bacterium]